MHTWRFPLSATVLGCVLSLACARSSAGGEDEGERPSGTSTDPLAGGEAAPDHTAVMLLRIQRAGGVQTCSGVRIGARTILTAAHCVHDVSAAEVHASAEAHVESLDAGEWLAIDALELHPGFGGADPELPNDLAAARLALPLSAPGLPYNRRPLEGFAGRDVELVGYGMGADGQNVGGLPGFVRNALTLELRGVSSTHLAVGDLASKGLCSGDSGGPSLHEFSDGIRRVVGIHSFTRTEQCNDGADLRLDPHWRRIDAWSQAWEGPRCAEEGACVEGCAVADPDCRCLADHVCAVGPCAVPDPDCLPDGSACSTDANCEGGLCLSLEADRAICSRSCQAELQCAESWKCEQRVCVPPPPQSSSPGCGAPSPCPDGGAGPAAASGCSAALPIDAAAPLAWLALLICRRRWVRAMGGTPNFSTGAEPWPFATPSCSSPRPSPPPDAASRRTSRWS